MKITVAGSTSIELQGAITVKATGAHITALDNTVTVAPDYDHIETAQKVFVRTINNVGPNSKGEFFISGSECTSWDYTNTGIRVVDLCPACDTCELLYRLKQEVIRLKLWLAVLRDINLFQQSSTQEAEMLWGRKFHPVAGCTSEYVLGSTFSTFAEDEGYQKGLQLVQQYMTTVHMWNYLVNRNNKSDLIQVASEDTAGFSVQTKRSLTSCGESGQSIRCQIKILDATMLKDDNSTQSLSELTSSYPVSVFIPRAVLSFEPFNKYQTAAGVPPTIVNIEGSTTNISILPADPDAPVFCRCVDTGVRPSVVAGTYQVTAKFLPFVYSEMVDEHGDPISIRGGRVYSDDEWKVTTGSTISFHFFAENTTPIPLERPTATNYLNSKTAPTCSVDFRIIWTIEIKWIVIDGTDKREETQTYYYTCNGIRTYYTDAIIGGSTITGGTASPEA